MGAKPSRRKSNGAGAPSEQKRDDHVAEFDTMPAEEAPQLDNIPRDVITQAVVSDEPEDVLNKSMETVETKMTSVSVENPTELVAVVPDPEAKLDSLMFFPQEASAKIEFSIPEAPADLTTIPCQPLTTGHNPEGLECGAEATDVQDLAMENEAVSGLEIPETDELLVWVNQNEAQSQG